MLQFKVEGGNIYVMKKAKIEEEILKLGGTITNDWWKQAMDLSYPIQGVFRYEDRVDFTFRSGDAVADTKFLIISQARNVWFAHGIDEAWGAELDHLVSRGFLKENIHIYFVDGIDTPDENGEVQVNVVLIDITLESVLVVNKAKIVEANGGQITRATIRGIQRHFNPDADTPPRIDTRGRGQ